MGRKVLGQGSRSARSPWLPFRFGRRHCGQSEENCCDETPENPDGARDAKTSERWVSRKRERTETAYRGQSREQDRLHHATNIMLDFLSLLPDQHNVYPIVHTD